ncbi:radical SAM/SPASM domain-containing protein [Bdellovibrionota bacterium FG-2]
MKKRLRFTKVHIEISNICNLHCSFCPEVTRPKGHIEVALFRKIIEQLPPLTEMVCFHLMGEPLVHPKLTELVEICHEHGLKIFFVTNGILLREPQAALLLHPAFRQVNFSLHSFLDNFAGKDPSHYLDRIFSFTERAFEERPDLYINFRLWNLASLHEHRTENLNFLERIGERFGVTLDPKVDLTQQKSRNIKGRLYLNSDAQFVWPNLNLPLQGERGTCFGLSNHFGILIDGTVVPCCLDKDACITLGHAQVQPLANILGTPRAQAMLQGFRDRRLVEDLCRRCQYIERF